jgi:transposase
MERHSMRKIREVLRLRHECGLKHREISASVGLSKGSVSDYLKRAQQAGLSWETARELDDVEVERRLFRYAGRNEPPKRAPIDFNWVHRELRRKGVTLQLLWLEYCEAVVKYPESLAPYHYSQFCDLYASFRKKVDVTMRQVHRAGEKVFLDFSGGKPKIHDRDTGEEVEVELFVAVLGASSYTYAEATRTQQLEDFVGATVRTFEYFGCVPQIAVPDQLRSAVSGPDRYDPEINPTYAEMAAHYGIAIIPARPRKPRDKAKVENGVLVAQRWILACLRNRIFYSLDELNEAIWELLERLNTRPFQKLEGCRRSAFETLDRPAMQPLPPRRYEVAQWKKAKVDIDYHVSYDERPYSVSCRLVGERVDVRATASTIEIFHKGRRVVSHARCWGPKGTPTTLEEHRPKSHREYGAWPPSRIISWAETVGPSVGRMVEHIMRSKSHPEMGYRSCRALIRDSKRYPSNRVDAACRRALEIGSPTRQSVLTILKRGLDRVSLEPPPIPPAVVHDNVRGGAYFDRKENES